MFVETFILNKVNKMSKFLKIFRWGVEEFFTQLEINKLRVLLHINRACAFAITIF